MERTTLRMARGTAPQTGVWPGVPAPESVSAESAPDEAGAPHTLVGPSARAAVPSPESLTVPDRTIFCTHCGAAMHEGSAFFHDCPSPSTTSAFCRECGSETGDGATTCPQGHALAT